MAFAGPIWSNILSDDDLPERLRGCPISISETEVREGDAFSHALNHSCDPNCGLKITSDRVVHVVTLRPIKKGEEVTIDYAMSQYYDRFTLYPSPPISVCECGYELCRKTKLGFQSLPDWRRYEYVRKDVVLPHVLAMTCRIEGLGSF